jgi:subtilase family serine protease
VFNEDGGNYWAATNSPTFGSALSYIPELAWNETSTFNGLGSGGGGASELIAKPAWQTGPGVPNDNARDVPDVAFSAAIHDAYYITLEGAIGGVAGTSASAPSFAGMVAILNQYQVAKGYQAKPGMGNINPQLYRLAQSAPTIFHDTTGGNNIVPCAQGTPGCLTGSYGYSAGVAYDQATGLGSMDGNNLVTQWNTATNGVTVTLTANPPSATVNSDVQLTATVIAANGTGVPTGTVSFFAANSSVPLGVGTLTAVGGVPAATVTFSASTVAAVAGIGTATLQAVYSGDPAFSSGSASFRLRIAVPSAASAIVVSVSPNPVLAYPADAQGLSWQADVKLSELAGVASMLTGFAIDSKAQSLAQYFPSTSIPASGSLTTSVVLRNLTVPLTSTFTFTGVDAFGSTPSGTPGLARPPSPSCAPLWF